MELDGVDDAIDAAAALYKEGKFEAGIDRLTRIRVRSFSELSRRQRYRTLANLGNGYLGTHDEARAAELFTEAAMFQPDDSDALALLAHASELQGDKAGAFRLAQELVTLRSCKRAAPVYVRCAPKEVRNATLSETTALWHSDPQVLISLTVRAINHGDFALASTLAQKLDSKFPDMAEGPLFLGQALFIRRASTRHAAATGVPDGMDLAEVARVDELLTEAHSRATRLKFDAAAASALRTRYQVRLLLGRENDAQDDLEECARLEPTNADVLLNRAIAVRHDDRRLALRLFRAAIAAGGGDRAKLMLALFLMTKEDDRTEALGILVAVAEGASDLCGDALGEAFALAVLGHSAVDTLSD